MSSSVGAMIDLAWTSFFFHALIAAAAVADSPLGFTSSPVTTSHRSFASKINEIWSLHLLKFFPFNLSTLSNRIDGIFHESQETKNYPNSPKKFHSKQQSSLLYFSQKSL